MNKRGQRHEALPTGRHHDACDGRPCRRLDPNRRRTRSPRDLRGRRGDTAERSSAQGRICPQSEERHLYYGLLGPQATSVTYLEPITVPTTGPEGAYLIVQDAPSGFQPTDAYGVGEIGVLPVSSPITEIRYTAGAVCHLGSGSEQACAPHGVPAGYVPAAPTPTEGPGTVYVPVGTTTVDVP